MTTPKTTALCDAIVADINALPDKISQAHAKTFWTSIVERALNAHKQLELEHAIEVEQRNKAAHQARSELLRGIADNHAPLLKRLRAHQAMMAPHQKERAQGKLLIEATEALARLSPSPILPTPISP